MFPLSAAQAQLDSDTALVVQLEGRVSLDKSGELWVLMSGQTVEPGQVVVTGPDGYAVLQLLDGSRMEVFPESRLIFRANRFDWRDLLDLYLGKIRLYIENLTHEDNSYRVTSPTAVISIRGTILDVEVSASQATIIQVDTGSVRVRHRLFPGKEVVVEAGQTLEVSPHAALAAAQSASPLGKVGRIARSAVEAVVRIKQIAENSAGGGEGGASTGGGSGPPPSGSDAGSNEPAPVPTEEENEAPPGDVIPP